MLFFEIKGDDTHKLEHLDMVDVACGGGRWSLEFSTEVKDASE